MSKRIVVGYDGSENAMNAVEFAVGLAKAGGGARGCPCARVVALYFPDTYGN